MARKVIPTIDTDVLVIGGGAAGLRAAIEARKSGVGVVLVSESPVGFRNNTAISKALFAAAGIGQERDDSPALHLQDTITAGRFLNDRRLVAAMVWGAEQQVTDLSEYGVVYQQSPAQAPAGQVYGHTYPRHVVAQAGRGINISRPMRQYASSMGTQFIEDLLITRLLRADGVVVGAMGIDSRGQVSVVSAKATVLATGGGGQVYLRTNNAVGMTGAGYVLAYEAGAVLRDMEFVQFYPTAWGKNGSKMCMYEWFLPRGAVLRNALGGDILPRHGIGNGAITRDILARAIMAEIADGRGIGGNVIFDFTTLPEEYAEGLYGFGLVDETGYIEKLPVAPTVHFFMGGVRINKDGETGIDGLYAAGEVCGGMHGANRIVGNALTEAFVFGAIAGSRAAARASGVGRTPSPPGEVAAEVNRLERLVAGGGRGDVGQLMLALKRVMWDNVGVLRSRAGLEDALEKIIAMRRERPMTSAADCRLLVKMDNMLTVSEMICRAALTRTESRGAHYRTDFPAEDGARWLKTIEIYRSEGEMLLRPVDIEGR
ncbi:MAG TPA: FAD-binding protein [Dehalococcoidia bacterium]|nr:FAD-binding protein [Dehalococcoidia bacterium]